MPADLRAYGDATFTAVYEREPGGRARGVYCDRADPRIRIGPDLIAEWHEARVADGSGGYFSISPGQLGSSVLLACKGKDDCPVGDVIRMLCANRTLTYVVTGLEPAWIEGLEPVTYLAEWPD